MSGSHHTRSRVLPVPLLLVALACQPDPSPNATTAAPQAEATASQASGQDGEQGARDPRKIGADANAVDPTPKNVIANVGDGTIDYAVLAERFELKINRLKDESKRTRVQRTRWLRRVTEQMVWQRAYALAVEQAGLEVDTSSVDKALDELKSDPELFARYLEKNAENEDSIRAARLAMLHEQALLESRGLTKATQQDAKAFYEANKEKMFSRPMPTARASHFLAAEGPRTGHGRVESVKPEDRAAASPETLKKWHDDALAHAAYLREQVLKPGVDFNEFTREFSEGPGQMRGGDMGVFDKARMVPKYGETVFSMKPGEVSEVIDTEKGIYVIKLFALYEPGILPFEAFEADILRQIDGQRFQEARVALKEELTKSLRIEWGMDAAGSQTKEAPRPPKVEKTDAVKALGADEAG